MEECTRKIFSEGIVVFESDEKSDQKEDDESDQDVKVPSSIAVAVRIRRRFSADSH